MSKTTDVVEVDVPGLRPIRVQLAEGGGPVTPASRVAARAVAEQAENLSGVGLDWGAGTGLLAIVAALNPRVTSIVAVEYDESAVEVARRNVRAHGLESKIRTLGADLFEPHDPCDSEVLDGIRERVDFMVANPPASPGGDGLEWRRRLLAGATRFLRDGAPSLIQISALYGRERIESLADDTPGYRYCGLVASSDWQPFDLRRADLRAALELYGTVEAAGGLPYEFRTDNGTQVGATEVLETGAAVFTRWQVHRFDRL
jgi:16S rRNA G966 N2-methylase RsmD